MKTIWSDHNLAFLAEHELFDGIPPAVLGELLNALAARARYVSEARLPLTIAGQRQEGLYVVLRGRLRWRQAAEDARVLTPERQALYTEFRLGDHLWEGRRTEGDCLGLPGALNPDARWAISLFGLGETELLQLRTDLCPGLLTRVESRLERYVARFLFNLSRLQAARQAELQQRLRYGLYKGVEARLAAFFLDVSRRDGEFRCTVVGQQALADYLLISRPALNRSLQALRETGLLDWQGRRYRLTDEEGLRRLTGWLGR